MATINVSDFGTHDGLNRDDVDLAIAAAADGDTIQLSSGTVSWTRALTLTRSLTIKGNTTVSLAGLATPIVDDLTTIQDDTPRPFNPTTSGLFKIRGDNLQVGRITGLTMTRGVSNLSNSSGVISMASIGNAPNYTCRVDHCHFLNNKDRSMTTGGWSYGLIDNNVFHQQGNQQTCEFGLSGFGGSGTTRCDAQWADYPRYGSRDFMFFESNTVISDTGAVTNGSTDASHGARFVIRYNYFHKTRPGWHGTEGGRARGTRCAQVYGNVINIPSGTAYSSSNRSGGSIYHDNTFQGAGMGTNNEHSNTVMFRMEGAAGVAGGTWKAPGFGPWDQCATRSDGTWHEGETPYVFFTGTDTGSVNTHGQVQDSGANFGGTDNRLGYTVQHTLPTDPDYLDAAGIIGNTPTTLDSIYYGSGDRGPANIWNAGYTYAIAKPLITLDQQGRGKGDLMAGAGTVADPVINTVYGDQRWPHQELEPCLSWNNRNTNGTPRDMGFGFPVTGIIQLNRDVYNFGPLDGGLGTADPQVIPDEVKDIYNAGGLPGINGVLWNEEYTYPHPLSGGAPGPVPIILLTGDLTFDNTIVGQTRPSTLMITNQGTADLHVTAISPPTGFSVAGTTTFTVTPGATANRTVTFEPLDDILYSGFTTVASDADSGVNTILTTGTGVIEGGGGHGKGRKKGVTIKKR